jgi:hypothetical protein
VFAEEKVSTGVKYVRVQVKNVVTMMGMTEEELCQERTY